MRTVEDCMRSAWQALLRGDLAERDRQCELARNLMTMRDRIDRGAPPADVIAPEPIRLPDESK